MTIKLYGFPGTRTNRVHWLLEELEIPYEYNQLALFQGEHKQPPHLARHPHGVVPAFDDGELRLIESTAIVLHLADKTGELAPAVGTKERARYYQFIIYAAATLDTPTIDYYFHTVFFPHERRDAAKAEKAKPILETALKFLTSELGAGPYLLGESFTAADVAIGYDLFLMHEAGFLPKDSSLGQYFARLSERPAFKAVFAPEKA